MSQPSAMRYFWKQTKRQPLRCSPRGYEIIHSTEVQQISEKHKTLQSHVENESDAEKSEVLSRTNETELLHTLRTNVQEERNQQIHDWLNDLQQCNNDSNKYFRNLRMINRQGLFQRQPLVNKKPTKFLVGQEETLARLSMSTS